MIMVITNSLVSSMLDFHGYLLHLVDLSILVLQKKRKQHSNMLSYVNNNLIELNCAVGFEGYSPSLSRQHQKGLVSHDFCDWSCAVYVCSPIVHVSSEYKCGVYGNLFQVNNVKEIHRKNTLLLVLLQLVLQPFRKPQ